MAQLDAMIQAMRGLADPETLRVLEGHLQRYGDIAGSKQPERDLNAKKKSSAQSSPADSMMDVGKQIEEARRIIEREKRLGPAPLPLQPPGYIQALIRTFDESREKYMQEQGIADSPGGDVRMLQTYCGDVKNCSRKDLSELELIDVPDMLVRKRHVGRFFLCRTVALPNLAVGMTVPVVSPFGHPIIVNFYNAPLLPISLGVAKLKDYCTVFPVGTIIAIKEPWLKMALTGDTCNMRVDSPTDLIILRPAYPVLKKVIWQESFWRLNLWEPPAVVKRTAEAWKKRGNEHFTKQDYLQAERDFSAGILQHPFTTVGKSVQHLLLLNRAATRLRLERYHHSLADSETALQHISELLVLSKGDEMKKAPLLKLQEKGMLRKALSLYGLEKWKLARAAFSTCMDNHPDSDEGRTGLLRASSRIAEHDKGDYDLLNLFKQSQVKPNSRLDVAGFAGPVRVSSFPDMGRGLVTTRDVKAGELLLVNKAIQAVYTEDLPHEILFSLNLLTNAGDKGCTTRLRIALAYKMYWTPELQKAVNGLFSGDNSGQGEAYPLDGTSVDTDSTISYVDPEIIDKVTTYNTFDLHGVKPDCSHDGLSGNDEKLPKNDADTASALFGPSSLINHGCMYNTAWDCIGDVQFVRAITDVPSGQQLLLSYVVDGPYEKRMTLMKQYLRKGATCNCQLCKDDRSDGIHQIKARDALFRKVEKEVKAITYSYNKPSAITGGIARVKKIISLMDGTFGEHRTQFRPDMLYAYMHIAFSYKLLSDAEPQEHNYDKSIEYHRRVLQSIGVIVDASDGNRLVKSVEAAPQDIPIASIPLAYHREGVLSMLQMAALYLRKGRDEQCRSWVKASMWAEHIRFGHDSEMFKIMHRKQLDRISLGSW